MSIGGAGEINKNTSNPISASIRPQIKKRNSLNYDNFYDIPFKKPKIKEEKKIFDDMNICESNTVKLELTPEIE